MGDRRCCCVEGCVIVEDNFNRTNSTNIGSNWTEEAEDSEIANNVLVIPLDGLVVTQKKHFHKTMLAWVDLPGLFSDGDFTTTAEVGDIYRVIVNYNEDDGTYYYGEYEVLSDGYTAEIRVGYHDGASDSTLDTDEVPVDPGAHQFTVCRNLNGIYAYDSQNEELQAWAIATSDNGGRKAGLANKGSGQTGSILEFDDFVWSEHYYTDPDCPKCGCECEGYPLKKTLTMTIVAAGSCDCLNGEELEFNHQDDSGDFVWYSDTDTPLQDMFCDYSLPWDLVLFCDTSPSCYLMDGQFILVDRTGSGGPSYCDLGELWNATGGPLPGNAWTCPVSIQCNPLVITYGPFECYENEELQTGHCSYYLVITE